MSTRVNGMSRDGEVLSCGEWARSHAAFGCCNATIAATVGLITTWLLAGFFFNEKVPHLRELPLNQKMSQPINPILERGAWSREEATFFTAGLMVGGMATGIVLGICYRATKIMKEIFMQEIVRPNKKKGE